MGTDSERPHPLTFSVIEVQKLQGPQAGGCPRWTWHSPAISVANLSAAGAVVWQSSRGNLHVRLVPVHALQGDRGCRVLPVEASEDPELEVGIHRHRHNCHKDVDRRLLLSTTRMCEHSSEEVHAPLQSWCMGRMTAK